MLRGDRHGSILSSFLFDLVIDWAMRDAMENQRFGIGLDDVHITALILQTIYVSWMKTSQMPKLC